MGARRCVSKKNFSLQRATYGNPGRMDTSQTGATIQFQMATAAPALHNDGKQRDNGAVGAPKWMANGV